MDYRGNLIDGLSELKADLETHHITGITNIGRNKIDCSLFTELQDNLWIGGTPAQIGILPSIFTAVLNLYPWEGYARDISVDYKQVEMLDSHNIDMHKAEDNADWVIRKMDEGRTVLVHCQAGINRSSFIAGMALVKLGLTLLDAINLMATKRTDIILSNPTFKKALMGFQPTR